MVRYIGRKRRRGARTNDDMVTVPAGTQISRTRRNGDIEVKTFDHDTLLPSDCVGDESLLINGEPWDYYEDWD